MIDFSPVYQEGLIVVCKDEKESCEFWRDIKDTFRKYDAHNDHSWMGSARHTQYRHRNYADGCVAYYLIKEGEEFRVSWCDVKYYQDHSPYNRAEIVEYCNIIVDYGTISDDQIDISYLLGGDMHD